MASDDNALGDERSPPQEFWSQQVRTKPLENPWPCVDEEIEANPKGYEFKETADSRVLEFSSLKGDGPIDQKLSDSERKWMDSVIDILSEVYTPNSDDTARSGVGLKNLGSTCYVNSVLQCLVHTVPLFISIMASDTGDSWKCTRIANPERLCLVCNLRRLFQMLTMGNGYVWPVKLVNNLNYFSKGLHRDEQYDARLFLVAIRTRLMEWHKEPSDSDENFIRKLFRAHAVRMLTCKGCENSLSRVEDIFYMELPVDESDSLYMALQSYMDIKVAYTCGRCGVAGGVIQKIEVNRFPPVVTFVLKRIDDKGNKVEKEVSFPIELDLTDYTVTRSGQHEYVLYAIIVHEGEKPMGGHFLTFARLSANEWSKFDDAIVSRVSEKKVLSQNAYMLFYVEKGTAWFSEAIVPFERRNHGMFLPF